VCSASPAGNCAHSAVKSSDRRGGRECAAENAEKVKRQHSGTFLHRIEALSLHGIDCMDLDSISTQGPRDGDAFSG
jgi:hypothetical protein